MHPLGPELPILAHVACARVCQQLYVLCASHALVRATVGIGTVIIVYIGVAYTGGGDDLNNPLGASSPVKNSPMRVVVRVEGAAVSGTQALRGVREGSAAGGQQCCVPMISVADRKHLMAAIQDLKAGSAAAPCAPVVRSACARLHLEEPQMLWYPPGGAQGARGEDRRVR